MPTRPITGPLTRSLSGGVTGVGGLGGNASYLWRNFATTGPRADEYEVYVPFGSEGRYSVYSFRAYVGNVLNMGRIREGIVGVNAHHTSASKTGTWTTSTTAEAYGGSSSWSATAGDTIQFTVSGHTIVLRTFVTTNGGFGLVAIDGDYTSATRLPAVTQADVDAGYFASGDIGKRYFQCYTDTGSIADEHLCLAEGLTNGAHTVTVMAKGTKLAASSAARCYVSGVAGCDGATLPTASNASMCYTRQVSNLGSGNLYSALGVTPEYTPSGFVNYQFIGENHGQETQSSATWEVDGAATVLAAGQYARGAAITMRRATAMTHPSTGATVVANKSAVFTFRQGGYGARLDYTMTWANAGAINSAYAGMLHVGDRNKTGAGSRNTDFPRASVGGVDVGGLAANNNTGVGQAQADVIEFSSDSHTTRAAVRINPATNVNGWAKSAPNFAFVQDRTDLQEKGYFSRSTSANPETVAVNDVHSGTVEWRVYRA